MRDGARAARPVFAVGIGLGLALLLAACSGAAARAPDPRSAALTKELGDACAPWEVFFESEAARERFEAAANATAAALRDGGVGVYLLEEPEPPGAALALARAALEANSDAHWLGCPVREGKLALRGEPAPWHLNVRFYASSRGFPARARAAAAEEDPGAVIVEGRPGSLAAHNVTSGRLVGRLAADPAVSRVSVPRRVRPADRFAARRALGCRGEEQCARGNATELAGGLTGAGEVILVADTGLDYGNGAYGSSIPYRLARDVATPCCGAGPADLPRTGKVSLYVAYKQSGATRTDFLDAPMGHGTHVASLAAGDAGPSGGPYAPLGAAPGARVAFFDMERNDGRGDGSLYVPPDEGTNLFRIGYEVAGARVFSFSWGSFDRADNPGITDESVSMDQFLYDHPDVVACVAAGNEGEGDGGERVPNSINTPAVAKNAIAVGASTNDRAAWLAYAGRGEIRDPGTYSRPLSAQSVRNDPGAHSAGLLAYFSSIGPTADGRIKPDVVVPGMLVLGATGDGNPATRELSFGINGGRETPCPDDCGPAGPAACDPATLTCACPAGLCGAGCGRALNASSGGPAGCLAASSGSNTGTACSGRGAPLAGRNACGCTAADAYGAYCERADASGRRGYDGGIYMMGTSMSTPVAAGLAALVREHFRTGRHASGIPTPADALEPSSALVKAVLVNGARELRGRAGLVSTSAGVHATVDDASPVGPHDGAGFGEVDLSRSLRLTPESSTRLIVRDRAPVSPAAPLSLCLRARSATDLSATLAWTDPPPSVTAARALVNDLDLMVERAGRTRYGNEFLYPDGSPPTRDDLNNVERVRVSGLSPGEIVAVRVRAYALSQGPSQPAALAVAGDLEPVDAASCGGCAAGGSATCAAGDGIPGAVPCSAGGLPIEGAPCAPMEASCGPGAADADGYVRFRTAIGWYALPCAGGSSSVPAYHRAYAFRCSDGYALHRTGCVPRASLPAAGSYPQACSVGEACEDPATGAPGHRACVGGRLSYACAPYGPAPAAGSAAACPLPGGGSGFVSGPESGCAPAACPYGYAWNGTACAGEDAYAAVSGEAECAGPEETRPCSLPRGTGTQSCVGLRWSPQCDLRQCVLGFRLVDGSCVFNNAPAFRQRGGAAAGAGAGPRAGPLSAPLALALALTLALALALVG